MALSQKYLERLESRRLSQGKDRPKRASPQQMVRVERAIKQQRIECAKGGWRASAKWLEENFPEDYPKAAPEAQRDCSNCPNPESAHAPRAVEPQPVANAPESPQNIPTALPAPSPIPLASAFWQGLLYGSRDALLSPADANTALRLVAHEVSTHCSGADFSETVRAGALRKALSERFGAKVWDVMNRLWRAAPVSPGASIPNEDQSHCSPGLKDCPPSMSVWRQEFNQEVSNEQRLLESMGGWCGG
jgi:hypothetical protein